MRIFFLIIIIIINSGSLLSENADSVGNRIGVNTNKFKYILETIYLNYADSVDIDYISEEAFRNMMSSLDKNSIYLNKEQLYTKRVNDQGSGVGIGIELRLINDTAVVYYVKEGTPADSVGLRPFDRILSVDDVNVVGKQINDIYGMLRGEKNTLLKVRMEKGFSGEIKKIDIMRNEVQISSLNISLIIPETKTGYINSKNFSKISHSEFMTEINKFKKKGIRSLIIDLRDNPGGFLEQVSLIIDEFLEPGKTISYTEARNPTYKQTITSTNNGCCEKIPLVLLLNKNSASACELFAGVLQDFDRGIVVGQRSFGKSSVQRLWNMIDSTGFQLTVAEYFTPLGRSIDIKKKDSITIDPAIKLSIDDTSYNKINDMVNQIGITGNLPVYRSENGRVILGGGGIFPDFLIEEEQNTLLTNVLNLRNIIFEYVYYYLIANKQLLDNDYRSDFEKFSGNFRVTDNMLFELKNLSYKKNVWNEEMFLKDKSKIRDFVKAEIGRILFGNKAYFAILLKSDKWIQKAVEVMPESDIINK
ncbi:MAG: S41 family peptidase [bacterium]